MQKQLDLRHNVLYEEIAQTKTITPDQATELNEIDSQLTAAKLEAERQCRKLATEPWSPSIEKAQEEG